MRTAPGQSTARVSAQNQLPPAVNQQVTAPHDPRSRNLDKSQEQSGTVDILAMLNWLVAHRYLGKDSISAKY